MIQPPTANFHPNLYSVVIRLILFFLNPETRDLQARINGASIQLKKLLKTGEFVLHSEEGAIQPSTQNESLN